MSQVYCLMGLSELQTQKLTVALLCIMLFSFGKFYWTGKELPVSITALLLVSPKIWFCLLHILALLFYPLSLCILWNQEMWLLLWWSSTFWWNFCFKICIFHWETFIISQEKCLFSKMLLLLVATICLFLICKAKIYIIKVLTMKLLIFCNKMCVWGFLENLTSFNFCTAPC